MSQPRRDDCQRVLSSRRASTCAGFRVNSSAAMLRNREPTAVIDLAMNVSAAPLENMAPGLKCPLCGALPREPPWLKEPQNICSAPEFFSRSYDIVTVGHATLPKHRRYRIRRTTRCPRRSNRDCLQTQLGRNRTLAMDLGRSRSVRSERHRNVTCGARMA